MAVDEVKGLFVVGPTRSGTSMTAGAFRACGVFFGETMPGVPGNRKGTVEHPVLRRYAKEGRPSGWPTPWYEALRGEGWDDGVPWGRSWGTGPGH